MNNFECLCEKDNTFCTNCYRWWTATTMSSFIALNREIPGHASSNQTKEMLISMRSFSPYTARASPSWAYIDDYLWYVLLWLDAFDWMHDPSDLEEAAQTMELSETPTPTQEVCALLVFDTFHHAPAVAEWAIDGECGGITWMYPDVDPRKNVSARFHVLDCGCFNTHLCFAGNHNFAGNSSLCQTGRLSRDARTESPGKNASRPSNCVVELFHRCRAPRIDELGARQCDWSN